MKHLEIKATARKEFGKKSAGAARREELVPCTLSGGAETIHFTIEKTDLKQLIFTPQSYIINFDVEGKKEVAVMREIQYHPVSDEPLHIDFYRVQKGKPLTIELPVELTGNAEGVKMGGKLQLAKRKIYVSALEEHLPDTLKVDVTELSLGKSIFVGDLHFANITMLTSASTAVCAVRMTRAARGAAAAATTDSK